MKSIAKPAKSRGKGRSRRPREATPAPARPFIRTAPNFANPPYWPEGNKALSLGRKFDLLLTIAPPDTAQAVHYVIDEMLRNEWWAVSRTSEGLEWLAWLMSDEDAA